MKMFTIMGTVFKLTWKYLLAVALILSVPGAYMGYVATNMENLNRQLNHDMEFFHNMVPKGV